MKSKKLIPRVLATITTIALMLTSTPLNTLTTFATGGGAGGGFGGGGGSTAVTDNPINDDDIGLRFSLVTKDASGTRVVPTIYSDENGNPKYYIDVWDNYSDNWYGAINSYSRYAPVASEENIKHWNDSSFDASIEALIAASGKGTVDMNISDHLEIAGASVSTFFTEGEGGLKINGNLFYNWFMEEAGTYEGEPQSRYFFYVNALYYDKLSGVDLANTFLVVEPLLHIANPNNKTAYKLLGTEYVASWFGYVEGNISGRKIDPGSASTLRDRFSNIGNHFQIKKTDYLTAEMQTKMTTVLGVGLPGQFTITGEEYPENSPFHKSSIAYGDGSCGKSSVPEHLRFNYSYRTQGYAMQIFWLKDLDPDTGKPIDTYDIINQDPNIPTPPEEPYDPDSSTDSDSSDTDTADTSGTKSIIKVYADLYKDDTTGLYTNITNIKSGDPNHPYAFAQTGVSNEVTITDEEPINGYRVAGWYTSNTAYDANNKANNDMLMATNMINVTDLAGIKDDGDVSLSNLGGKQLRIDGYVTAYSSDNKAGYNTHNQSQRYFAGLAEPHGAQGTGFDPTSSTGAKNYYTYKRLETKGTSNYGTYNYPINENDDVVTLSDTDETLVILYIRERTYISTSDLTPDTPTIPDNPDDRKDQSGNLTIVKLYGVINPNSYEITADPSKSSVVTKNTTRNVNINSESGYSFAEWIYITGGAPTNLTATRMGTTNLSTIKLDKTLDQAYRLDGFVDGFKNNSTLEQYFRFSNNGTLQLPTINIISTDDVSSSITPGRYSLGSRSGIGTGSYNSTLYLGGTGSLADNTPDDTDQNDVLYLLFLKTDQLSYSADDLIIPESYITRYDNYKHNPMTVKGSVSNTTYEEYLQAHKFKYVLPVVTNTEEYKDINPLFIPHIALTDKTQAGLITNATSVQRLQLNTDLTHEVNQLYIMGEEARSLNVYDYAEVSFYGHAVSSSKGVDVVNNVLSTNRNGRIEISSEQWSTHARASSLIGLNNCALPGGATLSITIPAANRQTVTITSYSSLLPTESAGYSQVQAYANANGKTAAFGDMPTSTTDAANRHNMLVESVAAGFEGLNVEQYFSDSDYDFSNTKDGGETYDAANTVYEQIKGEIPSGDNLYSVKSSKVYSVTDFTGKEDKYYYRPDGDVSFDAKGSANAIDIGNYKLATGNNKDGDGNTGDFDTNYEDKLNTSTVTYYTFYMNRVGQVLCIKSSTTAASAKANLTGTAAGDGAVVVANWSSTDPNGFTYTASLTSDIKLAAENTGIVEELYKQLEEGTGKDSATPWSKNNPNGEWYFEAFDGLSDRLMKII